jgi:hypothetical protein
MPKRKRNAYEDDGSRISQVRKNEISEKLTQSKKLLHRALKTAKGFERQKLGKRLKNATEAGSNSDVARIQREIEALKGLDLDKMADAQLYKSLLKVKVIAESEFLPEEVRRELPRPEGSEEERKALHNVTSGMRNMKPVKEVMEEVMSGMYIAMGIPAPVAKGKGGKKEPVKGILKNPVGVPRRAEPEEDEGMEEIEETGSDESSWEGFDSGDESEDMDTEGGVRIGDDENEEDDDEDELDEEALSHYDALIGASSDEESFDESKYDIKRSSQPSTRLSLSLSPSLSPSEIPSPSEAQSQSPSPPPQKAPKPAKAKTKEPPKKTGGSTFLPTLMGGYWSGSESSASDLEDDNLTAAPIRKNRPGQMARRAIWEKKFGERANHIKSGKGAVSEKRNKEKDDGWDAKRGAKDSGDRSRGRGGRQRDFRQATGENAVAVEPRKRGMGKKDDVGKLHPSWEAAKKAKETKKTATFQGRKVTFD